MYRSQRTRSLSSRRIAGMALALLIACAPAGADREAGPWTLTGWINFLTTGLRYRF